MKEAPPSGRKKLLWAIAAAAGVILAGGMVWLYAPAWVKPKPQPSELTLHPEKQDEILTAQAVNRLAGKLALDAAQQEKLAPLVAALRRDMQALRRQNAGNLPATFAAGRERMQGFMNSVDNLLTSGQREKFEQIRTERRANMELLRGMTPGGNF